MEGGSGGGVVLWEGGSGGGVVLWEGGVVLRINKVLVMNKPLNERINFLGINLKIIIYHLFIPIKLASVRKLVYQL